MRKKIKRVLSLFLFLTGITPLIFRLCFLKRDKILVLLYHHVRKPEDAFEAAVSSENFEKQMQFLRKHFEVISSGEALRIKERNEIPPRPLAVITFDDGYRDNLETAYPILKKYSLPATFFLATGSIGNGEPMWTSRVEALFKKTPVRDLSLETVSPARSYVLGSTDERMRICYEVKNEMKKVPDSRRRLILEELEEKTGLLPGEDEALQSEMLTWDQVRELAGDPGVEIGSHSVSHRMLANLPSEEIQKELEESKEKIEAEIGRAVHFLSYPGNSYNPAVQKLSEQTGYRAAFAVDQSLTSFGEDHFTLRRIHVEDEPLHVFQAEISLLLPFLRSLFYRCILS